MRTTLTEGISPVLSEDYPRVLEVRESSVRATHDFITEADIQFYKVQITDALPQVSVRACVRDFNQIVAGFIAVSSEKIDMLFVHPAWRSAGIGKRLVCYAIDGLGATIVDANEQALGFYKKLGFRVVARSETDSSGKPYPVLRLRLLQSGLKPKN